MTFSTYIKKLYEIAKLIKVTDRNKNVIDFDIASKKIINKLKKFQIDNNKKIIFVGNGGSSAIASHCSIDYSRTAGIRAQNFNDGASLTCLGNDYGYEHVFSKQIELHGTKNDILVAISSSGNSKNIINAVNMGIKKKMFVITLSGFKENNKLKNLGDFSFFVSNEKYGYVEILHLIILHSFLDILMLTNSKS
ncbi:MAG: phosphoheptose isomerase [Rickettsiales bacterium]|nr:phosphoheptose isomerase [Rickettsiales bacterium]|tara:strand:- start:16003 stop:16581 length:579 start_codon:yes stop_codon:yes gene_type:complete